MGEFQCGKHTRDADRAAALSGLHEGQGLPVSIEKQIGRCRSRRGLAAVEVEQGVAGGVPGEEEGAAADA